jgi:tRNA(fMet)-specific endonuclease VapC
MYLLDTNVCIQLLTGRSLSVQKRFFSYQPSEIKICSIVKAELEYGARHSQKITANLALLEQFCEPLESLSFDDRCAHYYGLIREELTQKGQLIGGNDMLIAATTLANQYILVTHNIKEFSRISNLLFEDWEIV